MVNYATIPDFYQKYYFSLKKFVSRHIDDEGLVDELVNDIFFAAFTSYSNFKHQSSEFSWLCSIAKHKIIDYYRKKKLKTILFSISPVFEDIADQALTPERDCLKNELKTEIKKTLIKLGKGYHQILRLKYIDGHRIKIIAKLLKISVKAVESRLIRAKRQFAAAWNYETSSPPHSHHRKTALSASGKPLSSRF